MMQGITMMGIPSKGMVVAAIPSAQPGEQSHHGLPSLTLRQAVGTSPSGSPSQCVCYELSVHLQVFVTLSTDGLRSDCDFG